MSTTTAMAMAMIAHVGNPVSSSILSTASSNVFSASSTRSCVVEVECDAWRADNSFVFTVCLDDEEEGGCCWMRTVECVERARMNRIAIVIWISFGKMNDMVGRFKVEWVSEWVSEWLGDCGVGWSRGRESWDRKK